MATVSGWIGDDTLYGTSVDDEIYGFLGDDVLKGFGGADRLDGSFGIDTAMYTDSTSGVSVNLETGLGHGGTAAGDTLVGIENLYGSSHNDFLTGNSAANTFYGLSGIDILSGGDGTDTLDGGGGNDTLKGGGGADHLVGGAGIDTLDYSESPQDATNDAGVFVELLAGTAMWGDAAGDTFSGIENITGSGYFDRLSGDGNANDLRGLAGTDILHGEGGNDRLEGGAGGDMLDGGLGVDTMIGGPGFDWYFVDNAGDVVIESAGQGTDFVFASASYALPAGAEIEDLVARTESPTAAIDLTGNASGNRIFGNYGHNTIDGGGGVDQMTGYYGSDLYFVDNAGDSVVEFGGEGLDEVRTSVSWTVTAGADVENLRTTDDDGTAAIDLTGNASGNVLRGNNGDNILNGGGGNDELAGRGGADSFLFDTPLDAAVNVDVIADFVVADDTIRLENTVFGAFAAGDLAEERFVIGAAAQDASDCIIYNDVTGALYYDSDGNGAGAAIQFAAVTPGTALTHLDFLIV